VPKPSPAWVTSPCKRCGEPISYYRSQMRKYCSKACRSDAVVTYPARPCDHCGTAYDRTHPRQRWCTTCVPSPDARTRLQRYGVNEAEWQALIARHDGLCWICRISPVDCVDHNHETGIVRGALCRVCNMVLHYVEHPDWWDEAKSYLQGR
jgi:hypothetical protein